jgi:hypothetical protein
MVGPEEPCGGGARRTPDRAAGRGEHRSLHLSIIAAWAVCTRLLPDLQNYSDAEDALGYATVVRSRSFEKLDSAGSAWQLMCMGIDALLPETVEPTSAAKWLSAASGSLALAVMYLTLTGAGAAATPALAATLLFSVAFGPWCYALSPDKYAPQLALASLILCWVGLRRRPLDWRFLSAFSLTVTLAVAVHPTSGLLGLALLPLLTQTWREAGARVALRQALVAGGTFVASLLVYYTVVTRAVVGIPLGSGTFHWASSYVGIPAESRSWGHLRPSSLLNAVIGLGRSLIGADVIVAHPSMLPLIAARFPDSLLVEEQWLAASLSESARRAAFACFGLGGVLGLALGARRLSLLARRSASGLWPEALQLARVTRAWLVPTVAFVIWWEPQNNEFWIAPAYGLVLLVALSLSRSLSRFDLWVMAAITVLIGAGNWISAIAPRLRRDSDYWYKEQAAVVNTTPERALVAEFGYMAAHYLEFYGKSAVFPVHFGGQNVRELRAALAGALNSRPEVVTVVVTDRVFRADSLPTGFVKARRKLAEDFARSLPEPASWVTVGERRLARYDAGDLRRALQDALDAR